MSRGRVGGSPARRRWHLAVAAVVTATVLGACSAAPAAEPQSSSSPSSPTSAKADPTTADRTIAPRTDIPPDPVLPPPSPGPASTGAGAPTTDDPSSAPPTDPDSTAGDDRSADPQDDPTPGDDGYPARPTEPAASDDDQFEEDVWVPAGDHRVPGTLTLPVADGGMAPAVLLLHGDFGDRHASEFDELEETLAARGIASLAIDFAGSGESEESQLDLSYDSMTLDANASFDYLLRDPEIDPRRVAVLGFSRGGAIAATMAGTRPDVAALVTWSGAVYDGYDELPDLHDQARADGYAQVGDDLEIPLAWFDSLEASRPLDDVAGYTGPVLAVVGSADDIVDPSVAQTFLDTVASTDKTLHVIDGADHGYSDEPEYGQEAVDTTSDWLVARLLG